MSRWKPDTAARHYVAKEFPSCAAAFLGGSAGTGNLNDYSDLDLVVIEQNPGLSYHYNTRKYGWLMESFVMTLESYREFFETAKREGIPTLIRICAEGRMIQGGPQAEFIREEALQALAEGPDEWAFEEIDRARYEITECLDDLEASPSPMEALFLIEQLAGLLPTFHLRLNRQWIGAGKWMARELQKYDALWCTSFEESVKTFHMSGDVTALLALAERTIAPSGGRLREGWLGSGPPAGSEDEEVPQESV